MSDNNFQKTAVSFIVGLGVGAALGILFAPKAGEDTRDYLLEGAKDAFDEAAATGRRFTRRAKQAVNDVAERVMDATEEVERARAKAAKSA
jgi:gas vesicle protein